MKFYSFLCLAFFSTVLTACSSSNFDTKSLKPEIYNGYWAMQPVEHQYRVLKFHQNGLIKIYDYSCHPDGSYSLNDIENVYLRTERTNYFTLLDAEQKPFAKYEILQLNAQRLLARQHFERKHPLMLNYVNLKGAKPLCY